MARDDRGAEGGKEGLVNLSARALSQAREMVDILEKNFGEERDAKKLLEATPPTRGQPLDQLETDLRELSTKLNVALHIIQGRILGRL